MMVVPIQHHHVPYQRIALYLCLLNRMETKHKAGEMRLSSPPVLMVQKDINAGIFTINANKKQRAPKKQFKLSAYLNYPQDEIIKLSIQRDFCLKLLRV